MQFAGFFHADPVTVEADRFQFLLEGEHFGRIMGCPARVGVDHGAINGNHPADEADGILPSLDLEGGEADVHVIPQLPPIDDESDIGVKADAFIDGLDLSRWASPLAQHFTPLFICQQAQAEATAAPVRPSLVFHNLVSILVHMSSPNIGITDELVEGAVSDAADAAIAVHEHLRSQALGVCGLLKGPDFLDGVDFGAGDDLARAIRFVLYHLGTCLNVASDAGVNEELREVVLHHLHDRRGFDDDPFSTPGGVPGDFAQEDHLPVGGNLGIEGDTDLSPEGSGDLDGFLDL